WDECSIPKNDLRNLGIGLLQEQPVGDGGKYSDRIQVETALKYCGIRGETLESTKSVATVMPNRRVECCVERLVGGRQNHEPPTYREQRRGSPKLLGIVGDMFQDVDVKDCIQGAFRFDLREGTKNGLNGIRESTELPFFDDACKEQRVRL